MKYFLPLCIIALTFGLVSAQDESPYTLETQCIEEQSQAPADWQFSGTILMRGYAGIHAYRQDWETPHVLIPEAQMPDALTDYGLVSPDGNWFAYVMGYTFTEFTMTRHAEIRGLRVVNLDNPTEAYEHRFFGQIYGFYGNQHPVPIWLDNEHLYLDHHIRPSNVLNKIWNPFTDELQDTELAYRGEYGHALYHLSPDASQYLGDVATAVFWLPDSSGYLLAEESEDQLSTSLKLIQAEEETLLWRLPENYGIKAYVGGFSPDGHYLSILLETREQTVHGLRRLAAGLYLLDRQEQRIINTCIQILDPRNFPMSLVWSPDSQHIAFLSRQFENTRNNLIPLLVLDIENYEVYRIAYQIQSALMLGWREN